MAHSGTYVWRVAQYRDKVVSFWLLIVAMVPNVKWHEYRLHSLQTVAWPVAPEGPLDTLEHTHMPLARGICSQSPIKAPIYATLESPKPPNNSVCFLLLTLSLPQYHI